MRSGSRSALRRLGRACSALRNVYWDRLPNPTTRCRRAGCGSAAWTLPVLRISTAGSRPLLRVCLDALKRRMSRREELTPDDQRRDIVAIAPGERPEEKAMLTDSIGVALFALRSRSRSSSVSEEARGLDFHYHRDDDGAALRARMHCAGKSVADMFFDGVHVAHCVDRDAADQG
jgi:hypothetical protein